MKSIRFSVLLVLSIALFFSCVTTKSMMDKGDFDGAYQAVSTKKLKAPAEDAQRLGDYFYSKKDYEKAIACYEIAYGGKNAALVKMGDKLSASALKDAKGNAQRLQAADYYRAGGDTAKANKLCEDILGWINWRGNKSKEFEAGRPVFRSMHSNEKDASLAWGRYIVAHLDGSFPPYSNELEPILKMIVTALEIGGADRSEVAIAVGKSYSTLHDNKGSYKDADLYWNTEVVPAEKIFGSLLPDPAERKMARLIFVKGLTTFSYDISMEMARKTGDAEYIKETAVAMTDWRIRDDKYTLRGLSSFDSSPAKELRDPLVAALGDQVKADGLLGEWLFKVEAYRLSAVAYDSAGDKKKAEVSWRAYAAQYLKTARRYENDEEKVISAIFLKIYSDPKEAWRETGDTLLNRDPLAAARSYENAGLKDKALQTYADIAKGWATSKDKKNLSDAAAMYVKAERFEEARKVAEDHLRRIALPGKEVGGYEYESVFVAAWGSREAALPRLASLSAELNLNEAAIGYYKALKMEKERRSVIAREVVKRINSGDLEKARDYAWGHFDYERKDADEFLAECLPEHKLFNEAYLINVKLGRQSQAAALLEKAVAEEADPARRLAAFGLVTRSGSQTAKKLLPVLAGDADPAISAPASYILSSKAGTKMRVALVSMGQPGRAAVYGMLATIGLLDAKQKLDAAAVKKDVPAGFSAILRNGLDARFELIEEKEIHPLKAANVEAEVDKAKLDELAASGSYDAVVAFWLNRDERNNSSPGSVSVDYQVCGLSRVGKVGIWESFVSPEFNLNVSTSASREQKEPKNTESAKDYVKYENQIAKEIASYLRTIYGN